MNVKEIKQFIFERYCSRMKPTKEDSSYSMNILKRRFVIAYN